MNMRYKISEIFRISVRFGTVFKGPCVKCIDDESHLPSY